MPMDRRLYPDNWQAIALAVKTAAGWRCQQCGRPCRMPGESVAALEARLLGLLTQEQPAPWWDDLYDWQSGQWRLAKPQQFGLTVAHLNHVPGDCQRENLKALCAPCHCRYDLKQMGLKRRLKAERMGQLRIEGV